MCIWEEQIVENNANRTKESRYTNADYSIIFCVKFTGEFWSGARRSYPFSFSVLSKNHLAIKIFSFTPLPTDIHFQYNGFLLGILLLSISCMYQVSFLMNKTDVYSRIQLQNQYLMSAIWFSTLLNFKHIFLYIAPAYVVYLFYAFCIRQSKTFDL